MRLFDAALEIDLLFHRDCQFGDFGGSFRSSAYAHAQQRSRAPRHSRPSCVWHRLRHRPRRSASIRVRLVDEAMRHVRRDTYRVLEAERIANAIDLGDGLPVEDHHAFLATVFVQTDGRARIEGCNAVDHARRAALARAQRRGARPFAVLVLSPRGSRIGGTDIRAFGASQHRVLERRRAMRA